MATKYSRKTGRPQKFDKEVFLKKLDEYLASRQDEPEIVRDRRGSKVVHLKVNLPTIPDFCEFLGITRVTLYNWKDWDEKKENLKTVKNKKEDIAMKRERKKIVEYAFEKILNEQYTRLINRGLAGEYNPTIAKLILTNNHGMKEKADITSGDKPIPLLDYVATRNNNSNKQD